MGAGLLQPGHLLVILIIVLVVFGPAKLPEIGGALGTGIKELKRALNADDEPATPADTARTEASAAVPLAACQRCGATPPVEARYCTQCGQHLAA